MAALALAALLALSACGGGDDGSVSSDGTGSTTTTSSAGPAGTAADDGATDAGAPGDDAPASTTTTAAPVGGQAAGGAGSGASEGSGAAVTPGPQKVPRAGTYTYRRVVTGDDASDSSSDSVIERLSGNDDTGRVRLTIESEQGKVANTADVSAGAGVIVLESVIDSPLGQIRCDWSPDWALTGPLVVGSAWTIDTTCTGSVGTTKVKVAMKGSGRVVRSESLAVLGQQVATWVVESDIVNTITVTSPTLSGTQRTTSKSTNWVDPARGINVKGVSDDQSSGDFASSTSHTEQSLTGFRAG